LLLCFALSMTFTEPLPRLGKSTCCRHRADIGAALAV
jgi:hypothetical protein